MGYNWFILSLKNHTVSSNKCKALPALNLQGQPNQQYLTRSTTIILQILTVRESASLIPRPSMPPVFVLQAIKNWRCRRPGNEARSHLLLSTAWKFPWQCNCSDLVGVPTIVSESQLPGWCLMKSVSDTKWKTGYSEWNVWRYPYLVSMLFANLLSLHLVTCNVFYSCN